MADDVERTPDGRYIVVGGRRWRASDPAIPDALRTELVRELMAARREVGAAHGEEPRTAAARARVQDAKVALGERGEPWWEAATDEGRADRLRAAILTLLRARDAESTICPSDAARVAGGVDWRPAVPVARDVAAGLTDAGVVDVRQRGRSVDPRQARGPLRIARGPSWPG